MYKNKFESYNYFLQEENIKKLRKIRENRRLLSLKELLGVKMKFVDTYTTNIINDCIIIQ